MIERDTFLTGDEQGPFSHHEMESMLVNRTICSRSMLDDRTEALYVCGTFQSSQKQKIVAMVEVRNVQHSIQPFLSALQAIVDSVIVLDDVSSDSTRNSILLASMEGKVEVVLNKTGDWIREELYDREILLRAARMVGGTHFLVLDYDEFLSWNCVEDGRLRRKILSLQPGQSLYIPWIEVWKSLEIERVLPTDHNMNFLMRRATAIFADDGKFHYSAATSLSRDLGASATRNGSIHVLRCPREICPQPNRYVGSHTVISNSPSVQTMPECRIIEIRFLNLNNILLKSAWYEALGHMMNASQATQGKMLKLLFPHEVDDAPKKKRPWNDPRVVLRRIDPHFLEGYRGFLDDAYNRVEIWRAHELLAWRKAAVSGSIDGLNVVSRIDLQALDNAIRQANDMGKVLRHVPRRKKGTLVLAIEYEDTMVASAFLKTLGWSLVQIPIGVVNGFTVADGKSYEEWTTDIENVIQQTLSQSTSRTIYITTAGRSEKWTQAVLNLLCDEFADFHVVVLFATWENGSIQMSQAFNSAMDIAIQPGSHVRLIDMPLRSFGSYGALHWLRSRLGRTDGGLENRTQENNELLLNLTESIHTTFQPATGKLLPVARLIFSLNVGRSGSKYLADVLGTVSGPIHAVHEASCERRACTSGGSMRMQDQSLEESYERRKNIKIPMIRRALAGVFEDFVEPAVRSLQCEQMSSVVDRDYDGHNRLEGFRPFVEVNSITGCILHEVRDAVYAETNPNFKSWFYDIVLDEFPQKRYEVSVVVIRKYIAATMKSLYETGYFTLRDGYNWMETATSVNSHIRNAALSDDSKLSPLEKLGSYLINSQVLFQDVCDEYGKREGIHFVEIRAEEMYSQAGTLKLLRTLKLISTTRTLEIAGAVRDKYRSAGGKQRYARMSIIECEKVLSKLMAAIEMNGGDGKALLHGVGRVEDFKYDMSR